MADSEINKCVQFLKAIEGESYERPATLRFWNGDTLEPATASSFELHLKHPGAIRSMFNPFNPVSLGEAYIFDDFEIKGDIFSFVQWLRHILHQQDGWNMAKKFKMLTRYLKLPKPAQKSLAGPAQYQGKPRTKGQGIPEDQAGISLHYDRPSSFYRLFLGPTMVYTCAYFNRPESTLDEAQRHKLDVICKKLRLKPGMKLLDIGCGWGSLLRHAVMNYGVTGVGVTLAGEQANYALEANRRAGLQDQITIEYCDYRQMPYQEEFDAISSVGMTEEVGLHNLPVYMQQVAKSLKTGGVYLHHAINLRAHTPFPRWTAFARKYVFPNGHLQTLLQVHSMAAQFGLEVRDVENLREHYSLTLKAWTKNLEQARDEVLQITDEITYRIYRLYMAGATLGFDSGIYQLNQTLFVKPDAAGVSGLPLSRADFLS